MHITGTFLACLVLGQALDETLPPGGMYTVSTSPAASVPSSSTPSTFVQPAAAYTPVAPSSASSASTATAPASLAPPSASGASTSPPRTRPPEMVAEAAILPTGGLINGKPLTLINAVSVTVDRRQQMEIIHSYWGLVQAVGEYHYCADHWQSLSSLKGRGGNDTLLRPAQAAAAAQVRQAELNLLGRQYELAALLGQPANMPLPLPADLPHVGAYRTYFNELFAGRSAPEQARLAEKKLPIQRQMVDEQAAAVLAAEDARSALGEEFSNGRAESTSVISCASDLLAQRQAFIAAVCRYNQSIADYGLAVALPTATPQSLVAMLIGPAQAMSLPAQSALQQPVASQNFGPPPSGYQQPIRTAVRTEPTRANPATRPEPAGQSFGVPAGQTFGTPAGSQPTPAPPREAPSRSSFEMQTPGTTANQPGRITPDDPTPPATLSPPQARNEPTPAPPREIWQNDGRMSDAETPRSFANEPTPAPPRETATAARSPLGPRYDTVRPVDNEEPAAPLPESKAPPRRKSPEEPAPLQEDPATEKPLVPATSDTAAPSRAQPDGKPLLVDPMPRMVRKPSVDGTSHASSGAIESSATAPLYPALIGAAAPVQANQLTAALHWDRSLPADAGKPMSLSDCLWRDPNADKRGTVETFWLVRQRAAEYQLLAGEADFYEALTPAVLERRREPSGPSDMLRLRSAQLAAQATLREKHAALIEAQYALAMRLGMLADPVWPLASTIPHSGSYLLKLEVQARGVAETWAVRRLAAMIPGQSENVQQRAAAVVEADAARATAAEQYRAGQASIAAVLATIAEQRQQTAAFLESLTAYNRSIAEYALGVLPPGTPADKIVSALVVKP